MKTPDYEGLADFLSLLGRNLHTSATLSAKPGDWEKHIVAWINCAGPRNTALNFKAAAEVLRALEKLAHTPHGFQITHTRDMLFIVECSELSRFEIGNTPEAALVAAAKVLEGAPKL